MNELLEFLNPHENERDNKCYYCGYDCEGDFCSDECKKADIQENCR